MKKEFIDYLLWMFFALIGVLTLFNPKGHTPIPLLISITIFVFLFLKFSLRSRLAYPFLPEDLFLIFFLLISTLSATLYVSVNDLNLNHLYGEFVIIFFYYFIIKLALFNSEYFLKEGRLYNAILVGALIVSLSGIADYFLLMNGIDITTILPMEQANKFSGAGVFSRARSFLPEPTEYALCLNSLFPILIFRASEKSNKKLLYFLTILYSFSLITTFSAAGFLSIGVALLLVYLLKLFVGRGNVIDNVKVLVSFAVFLVLLVMIVNLMFGENYFLPIITKIVFSEESTSAMARLVAYKRGLDFFFRDISSVLVGNGTGFFSGLGEGSTHNWWLTVLGEKGILGFGAILLLLHATFLRLIKIKGYIKYGLFISIIAASLHYNTLTGFYYPFFWLLLVSVQYQFYIERGYELGVVSRQLEPAVVQ